MPRITLQVDTQGQVKQEGHGFKARQCESPMRRLAQALGADPETLAPEWKPESLQSEQEQIAN